MQLFYTPDISGNEYILNEQESRHCIRVLRMKINDILFLTDGKGTLFKAKIIDANLKKCKLSVVETSYDYGKRDYGIHIAIAPTKNTDRFEWFLEKATEIGVDEITPLLCMHSERKQIKNERMERVIIAAMKQSLKAFKPILNELVSFDQFISQEYNRYHCFIAHCQDGDKHNLKDVIQQAQGSLILIGPEGDFSEEEISKALTRGYTPVSLSNSRLRTETAGIVACNTINLANM